MRLSLTIRSLRFCSTAGLLLLILSSCGPNVDRDRARMYRKLAGCYLADPVLARRSSDWNDGRYHYVAFPARMEFYFAPAADTLPLRMRSADDNPVPMYRMETPYRPPVRLISADSAQLDVGIGIDDWVQLRFKVFPDSLYGVSWHLSAVAEGRRLLDGVVLRRYPCPNQSNQ